MILSRRRFVPAVGALLLLLLNSGFAHAQVTADFSGAPLFGCSPLPVVFADASTGPVDSWLWDFGDGAFSDEQNPVHIYDMPGVYTVRLTTAAAGGATPDTRTRVSYVQAIGPNVRFSSTPNNHASAPATEDFTDQTIFGAPITGWQWDFGDGNTSSVQNPGHTYTATGIYPVSLTVTDIDGCSRMLTKPGLVQVGARVAVTMGDAVIANPAGAGRAQPGSVIRYTVTIQNSGTEPLDAAELNVAIDPDTTAVPEVINEQD